MVYITVGVVLGLAPRHGGIPSSKVSGLEFILTIDFVPFPKVINEAIDSLNR